MKITDVKTVLLTGPCSKDPYVLLVRKRRSAAFIEIHTDTEIVGIGETYGGYFFPEVIPEIVEFFKPILIGRDVSNIQKMWNDMYQCGNFWCRVGLGVAVLNGIEAALWDIKGKMFGVPVYELFGGSRHDKLLAYATGGPANYPKPEFVKKMDFYLGLGFKALKFAVGCSMNEIDNTDAAAFENYYIPKKPLEAAEFEADKMEFVRKHIGKDIEIMMDAHMGNSPITWDIATAKAVCKAIEPYDMFFFEEALHYTDPQGYAELCKSTTVPIAGGECLTGTSEWRVFNDAESFDIAQPDASFTGGLLEFNKVASMYENKGKKIATHSWGAGGSLMQNIHCGFACANTVILEVPPAYAGLHEEMIGESFVMEDGFVLPPQTPGLGIILTDEIKNKYQFIRGSGEFNDAPGKILKD
jgi:L-alanine-DL-glutamate epimerase-like enolase superfamily enzyme